MTNPNDYSFAQRAIDVPSSGIGLMMRYASAYPDTVSLGQGTPLFPTPQFIYEYVQEKAKEDPAVGQYALTPLENQLKELISAQMNNLYGFSPKNEELTLTVGGVGGLFAAFMSILNPQDEIIYFDPSYPIHLSQLAIAQAKVVYVPLNEDSGWTINIDLLKKSITSKTKAILLTNPNNPTGTILTKNEIDELIRIVIENNLYLVLDEAYHFLSYGTPVISPASYPEVRNNLILVKSFSKEFAMTGWRIGYVYANSEIQKKIGSNINTYTCLSPATISIHAAICAMSDPRGEEAMKGFINEFTKSRETICRRMDKLTKLFQYQKPQGAYYLFPKLVAFNDLSALEFCQKLVREAGVITIPGDSSGPAGIRHIRMSFAADSLIIEKAFDKIDEFARKYNLL